MRDYFKRLPQHSGFMFGVTIPLLAMIAGLKNPNADTPSVLIIGGIVTVLIWIPILITNRKKK